MTISHEKAILIISNGLRETFFDYSLSREIIETQLKKIIEKYELPENISVEEFESFVLFFGKENIRGNNIKEKFESRKKYSDYLKKYHWESEKSWSEIIKICSVLFGEEKEMRGVLGNEVEFFRSYYLIIESELKTIESLGLNIKNTNREEFISFLSFYKYFLWKFDRRNTFHGPQILYIFLSDPESKKYDYVSRGTNSKYIRETGISINDERQKVVKVFGLKENATWKDILEVGTYIAYLKFSNKN